MQLLDELYIAYRNLLHFLKDCYKITHLPFEETEELHKEIQKYKEKKSLCNSCRIYNLIIIGFQTVLMETESANLTPKVTHIKTHK